MHPNKAPNDIKFSTCTKGDCCKQGKFVFRFYPVGYSFYPVGYSFYPVGYSFYPVGYSFYPVGYSFYPCLLLILPSCYSFYPDWVQVNVYPITYFSLLTHTIGPASIMKDRWKFFECKRCSNYCRSDRFNKEEGHCKKDCQPYLSQEALA
jgi:hypothetical protein